MKKMTPGSIDGATSCITRRIMKVSLKSTVTLWFFLIFAMAPAYGAEPTKVLIAHGAISHNVVTCHGAISNKVEPLWIAKEQGIFRKYNIEAELVFIIAGRAMQAMLAGQ